MEEDGLLISDFWWILEEAFRGENGKNELHVLIDHNGKPMKLALQYAAIEKA